MCDFWVVMDVLCCTASIFHLVGIAIDRYWAVTRADYSRRNNKKIIFGMIVCVWVAAASLSLPGRFAITNTSTMAHQVIHEGVCIINQDKFYTVISTGGAFYLPMAFLVCIYLNIYVSARGRIRKSRFKRFAASSTVNSFAKENFTVVTQPSPAKPLANGAIVNSITRKLYSEDQSRYSEQDTSLRSPSLWNDDEAFELNGVNSPTPIDMPVHIASPFLRPTPLPSPARALPQGSEEASTSQTAITPASPMLLLSSTESKTGCATTPQHCFKKRGQTAVFGGNMTRKMMVQRKLCLASAMTESAQQRKERLEHRRERRAARTLAIITGGFVLCWLPFSLVAFVTPWCRERCQMPRAAHSILLWLGYVNSFLNPIIYTIFSPDFRVVFVRILTRKYCRKRI